jgi:hypothetical protein
MVSVNSQDGLSLDIVKAWWLPFGKLRNRSVKAWWLSLVEAWWLSLVEARVFQGVVRWAEGVRIRRDFWNRPTAPYKDKRDWIWFRW